MKFSHLLKFNIVPEWRKEYINYSALKKAIYAIAKAEAGEGQPHEEEGAAAEPLLGRTVGTTRVGKLPSDPFQCMVHGTWHTATNCCLPN